jgi:hypothetical protein
MRYIPARHIARPPDIPIRDFDCDICLSAPRMITSTNPIFERQL